MTYEVFVTDQASGQRESTDEYQELLDGLIRRERIERAGGVSNDYPPVLERLGVSAAQWEKLVRMTSRRFTRELDLMAKMFAEDFRLGIASHVFQRQDRDRLSAWLLSGNLFGQP